MERSVFQSARIARTLSLGPLDTVLPGDVLTYTIVVNNIGSQGGTGIVVTDTFPAGILTSLTASNGGIVELDALVLGGLHTPLLRLHHVAIYEPRRAQHTNDVDDCVPSRGRSETPRSWFPTAATS